MKPLTARICLLGLALLIVGGPTACAEEESRLRLFDGQPRLLIVHGYSTSRHWWAFLQRKIDRYSGIDADRMVEVQLCNKGGTPIARWIDVETGEPSVAWKRMLTPMIQAESGVRPVIVLAQQSLQYVYPESRSAGIRDGDDDLRITTGADAIETYANRILLDGADAVFVGMHIYKHSMEPAIGNERLALTSLINRNPSPKGIFAGPDTWTPTRQHFPLAFDTDKLHPNFVGAEIMAHYWFDALLSHEGLATPEWSREEMRKAINERPMGIVRDNDLFAKSLTDWNIVSRQPRPPQRERHDRAGAR